MGSWIETPWQPCRGEVSGHRYVALQAIYNSQRQPVACEVLSRSGRGNRFDGNSDEATRRMIDDWNYHGLAELTGRQPVFLNCTRESLLSGILLRLPRSIVLEVLETIVADEELLDACRKLKRRGFRIALDDFRPSEDMREIVGLADFIKVDFRLSNKTEREAIFHFQGQSRAILIAEKIETMEEFETAKREPFLLFQGYFLSRPTVFSRRSDNMSSATSC